MNRLLHIWRILNLSCEGSARLASEGLDRPLSRLERVGLRSHIMICRVCRQYKRQVEQLHQAMRRGEQRLDDLLPGPAMPDDLRERLRKITSGE